MNTKEQLSHFRKLRAKADGPAELIGWLTIPVLMEAGFEIYCKMDHFICAQREKDGLEVRLSMTNKTIGGTKSDAPRRKGRPGFIENTQEALKALMFDDHHQPPQVRVTTTRELTWGEVVAMI